jgi:CRP-like cAMP-binding protein
MTVSELLIAEERDIKEDDFFDFTEKRPPANTHRLFWKALYNTLSDDEADAIDSATIKAVFRPGQEIIRQGEFNRSLFLLERGQAKHIFAHYGREMFIKKVKPGNIIGEEYFFDGGCCTTSLVAMEPVKVRILSEKKLREIRYYDDLEGRLKDFCSGEISIQTLLNQNAQDRRQNNRLPMKGLALIKDVEGMAVLGSTTLKGEARDISCGGIAVKVKLAGSYEAQLLLGHNFKIRFNLPPNMTVIDRAGQVLGGKALEDSDLSPGDEQKYLLNIRFAEPLEPGILTEYTDYVKMISGPRS